MQQATPILVSIDGQSSDQSQLLTAFTRELVGRFGVGGALDALNQYVSLNWISGSVRDVLADCVTSFSAQVEEMPSCEPIAEAVSQPYRRTHLLVYGEHIVSFEFILRLAGEDPTEVFNDARSILSDLAIVPQM